MPSNTLIQTSRAKYVDQFLAQIEACENGMNTANHTLENRNKIEEIHNFFHQHGLGNKQFQTATENLNKAGKALEMLSLLTDQSDDNGQKDIKKYLQRFQETKEKLDRISAKLPMDHGTIAKLDNSKISKL